MFQIHFFQKVPFGVQMTFILAGGQLPLQYFIHANMENEILQHCVKLKQYQEIIIHTTLKIGSKL